MWDQLTWQLPLRSVASGDSTREHGKRTAGTAAAAATASVDTDEIFLQALKGKEQEEQGLEQQGQEQQLGNEQMETSA
eukprot:1153022-Pelagomonas_calceolata.AAC.5